jgi:hypothetical protein
MFKKLIFYLLKNKTKMNFFLLKKYFNFIKENIYICFLKIFFLFLIFIFWFIEKKKIF